MIRVLLADDHPATMAGVAAFLEKEPEIVIVKLVSNGREVLEYLSHSHKEVDVVILDIEMPELNGIETAEHIKKNYRRLKILILTMHDESDFINHLLHVGVNGYIFKNIDRKTLINAIISVFRKGKYFPEDIIDRAGSRPKKIKEGINLTTREKQVLSLVGKAMLAKDIARELNIEENTVNTHLKNLRNKLGLPNAQALVRYSIINGYTK